MAQEMVRDRARPRGRARRAPAARGRARSSSWESPPRVGRRGRASSTAQTTPPLGILWRAGGVVPPWGVPVQPRAPSCRWDGREQNGWPQVSGPAVSEARETSGATTGLLLSYVRQQGGDDAVVEVLRRAGVPPTAAELELPSNWISYDTRIKLFAAATEVLGDPKTMFRIGSEALGLGLTPALVLLVRAMGSPRQVYRQLPRAVAKFTTTSTMRVVESGATHATLSYRLHEGYRHSRRDCEYAQGLIGMVPTIFGLPPAELLHSERESDGHPVCTYHLTWERRRR